MAKSTFFLQCALPQSSSLPLLSLHWRTIPLLLPLPLTDRVLLNEGENPLMTPVMTWLRTLCLQKWYVWDTGYITIIHAWCLYYHILQSQPKPVPSSQNRVLGEIETSMWYNRAGSFLALLTLQLVTLSLLLYSQITLMFVKSWRAGWQLWNRQDLSGPWVNPRYMRTCKYCMQLGQHVIEMSLISDVTYKSCL